MQNIPVRQAEVDPTEKNFFQRSLPRNVTKSQLFYGNFRLLKWVFFWIAHFFPFCTKS